MGETTGEQHPTNGRPDRELSSSGARQPGGDGMTGGQDIYPASWTTGGQDSSQWTMPDNWLVGWGSFTAKGVSCSKGRRQRR